MDACAGAADAISRRLGIYTNEVPLLTVGDGDLSFSLSLAKGLRFAKVSTTKRLSMLPMDR